LSTKKVNLGSNVREINFNSSLTLTKNNNSFNFSIDSNGDLTISPTPFSNPNFKNITFGSNENSFDLIINRNGGILKILYERDTANDIDTFFLFNLTTEYNSDTYFRIAPSQLSASGTKITAGSPLNRTHTILKNGTIVFKDLNNDSEEEKIGIYINNDGDLVISENMTTVTDYWFSGEEQIIDTTAGSYLFELWGADGGDVPGYSGGKGGYTWFTRTTIGTGRYRAYIGGKGSSGVQSTSEFSYGGWNGGGNGGSRDSYSAGGGGATDFRVTNSAYENRYFVAGGGGGATDYYRVLESANPTPGNGGGQSGTGAYPGTQSGTTNPTVFGSFQTPAGFGFGGAVSLTNIMTGPGGGGGWYGGQSGYYGNNGTYSSSGGSGYLKPQYYKQGATLSYGDSGFKENPDITGNGHVRITYTKPF